MRLDHHVLVLGAGPIGLEAALYAAQAGFDVHVLEAGEIGEHCRRWGHVRLFTPWSLNASPLARTRLRQAGAWHVNEDEHPTGLELAETFLEPLASLPALRDRVHRRHRVVGVARDSLLKGEGIGDGTRDPLPFRVLTDTPDGERVFEADVVIDATGVLGQPNALGAGGIPALGERVFEDFVVRGIPDVEGKDRARFADRRILVVGGGLSAATTIRSFTSIGVREVFWLTRGGKPPLRPIPDDPLPDRNYLIQVVNNLARTGAVRHVIAPGVRALARDGEAIRVSVDGAEDIVCDVVVNQTGFHPDASIHRELQVHQCYASEGTMKLAAAILGAGGGDCMEQAGFGPESLVNPEPGFFILGNKSYGRNPDFLLRIGHEQVRDVFRLVSGDTALDLYAAEPSRA